MRERKIASRIGQRLTQLAAVSHLPSSIQTQSVIEIKQLQLLTLQRDVRQKVLDAMRANVAAAAALDPAAFRRSR